MSDLEIFIQHYIIAALWSSTDDNDEPLDANYGNEDIADETLDKIKVDCEKFLEENGKYFTTDRELELAGHDFWLTRNHHGAGFWDGDWCGRDKNKREIGEILTESAHKFGEVWLYVGDDGKIYC